MESSKVEQKYNFFQKLTILHTLAYAVGKVRFRPVLN